MIAHNRRRAGRAGTTLTEVLMAMLVMGIGLVSVATLFPLSLLRSIEATQLTNATLLRLNAEARIRAIQSTTATGAAIERGIIEDPNANGDVQEHDATKFVFDPLGMATFASDSSGLATSFGWIDGNGNRQYDGAAESGVVGVSRFAFGMETSATFLDDARGFTTLPDSFITLADQLAGNFSYATGTPAVVTMGGASPSLAEYSTQMVRITALRADIRGSAVRYGTVTSANTIELTSPLPSTYVNANIGRLLIDIPELRYTWFATVRRYGVRPSVTVVSCFRRNFSPEDERVYLCEEPAGSYNEFEINLEATGNANPDATGGTGGLPPGLERGGWMFDLYTFRWWKIASVQEFMKSGVKWARFTTDPEELDPSPRPRTTVYAIFPRNVVEAYTLKKE